MKKASVVLPRTFYDSYLVHCWQWKRKKIIARNFWLSVSAPLISVVRSYIVYIQVNKEENGFMTLQLFSIFCIFNDCRRPVTRPVRVASILSYRILQKKEKRKIYDRVFTERRYTTYFLGKQSAVTILKKKLLLLDRVCRRIIFHTISGKNSRLERSDQCFSPGRVQIP